MLGMVSRLQYHSSPALEAAILRVQSIAAAHGLDSHEVALRWVQHHSVLKPEFGDAMIITSSSPAQLEKTMQSLALGPLPKEVADTVAGIWEIVTDTAPDYSPFLEGGLFDKMMASQK